MNETVNLTMALAEGVLLGGIFFGGLWWTVRMGVSSQWPALWFFGSLLVRMGIVLTGFYFVSDGRGERILLCLFGFVMGRLIVTQLVQTAKKPACPGQGASHAP